MKPLNDNIFSHGDDSYNYHVPIELNFSTNVWYRGMPQLLREFLGDAFDQVKSYPSISGRHTHALAERLHLQKEAILICNGTTEAIYLIAQLYSGRKSRIFIPSFSEYERACRIFNHQITFNRWDELDKVPANDDAIWWICNPVNPTGKLFKRDKLVDLVKLHPNAVFIMDEAYGFYSRYQQSLIHDSQVFNNVVVLRSLTKELSVPGLRIGLLIADKVLVNSFIKIKQPWSVNSLALAVIDYYSSCELMAESEMSEYQMIRSEFQKSLDLLPGCKSYSTDTGYFIAETPFLANWLKDKLVHDHRILIRDASNFRNLNDRTIRLNTLDCLSNNKLLQALTQIIENNH